MGNILQWFSSFLCDRKQRVKIGDVYSSYASVSSGVPQGSCTGPLLFILYANDLPDSHQGSETMVCLFADDTKLSRVLSSIENRFELQEGLNDFMNWADQWQLKVAEHKCLVLSHGNCDPPSYYLKDVNLDNVDHHKDLGVELRTQNSLFRSVQPGDSTLRLIGVAIMRVTFCDRCNC